MWKENSGIIHYKNFTSRFLLFLWNKDFDKLIDWLSEPKIIYKCILLYILLFLPMPYKSRMLLIIIANRTWLIAHLKSSAGEHHTIRGDLRSRKFFFYFGLSFLLIYPAWCSIRCNIYIRCCWRVWVFILQLLVKVMACTSFSLGLNYLLWKFWIRFPKASKIAQVWSSCTPYRSSG